MEAVYLKIAKRIMPMLTLLFAVAWLDSVNVGFAKLHMSSDLGFSEAVYGFGAGVFFLGYFLFEIPSNLLLEQIGARQDDCSDCTIMGTREHRYHVREHSLVVLRSTFSARGVRGWLRLAFICT